MINLFIHLKKLSRILQENQHELRKKLLIFNAFVMINLKKIQEVLQKNCYDKKLTLTLENNYNDIYNKRIGKILKKMKIRFLESEENDLVDAFNKKIK